MDEERRCFCPNVSRSGTGGLRGWMLALGLLACVFGWDVVAGDSAGAEVAVHRMQRDGQLDELLTGEAQRILDGLELLDGQVAGGRVVVVMNIESGIMTVNFERGFLPENYGAAFEDQHDSFRAHLEHVAKGVVSVNDIVYLYGGLPIEVHFPEEFSIRDGLGVKLPKLTRSGPGGLAFISASHGYYYHHTHRQWVLQRPVGIVKEDLITPEYADELSALMEERSDMAVLRPRSQARGVMHEESEQDWWKVAARYSIEQRYPDELDIWHSKRNRPVYGQRDYDEDMNSRPYLANHEAADVAIHLHTNGVDNLPETIRGGLVVAQRGRNTSIDLARSVICYMDEIIHSAEGYEEFPIRQAPLIANKGENRLARMPSVIVEMAYHTNSLDAEALQDPVFRSAAMKGVEKGWRLFSQGASCTPLKTLSVPAVSMPQQSERKAEIKWEGFPEYPLRIETRNVACPPRWTCTDGLRVINAPSDEPLQLRLACNGNGSAPVHWATRLVDADGVATKEVRHTQQCIRKPGSNVPDPGAGVQVRADIVSSDDVPARAMYR